ncbi:transketolase [Steroidobacter cummioxidans]|uniref:transketolase n=1 Tax=Steroidobacter cummioxidans TaxID=1803913 RepID=UPI000E319F24|nr:transketolase [Steroidobacter cummioxidans]
MSNSFDPAALRRTILEMAFAGSTVHIVCAFSIVEILAVLYRNHLHLGDGTPRAEGRDYLVLSKGHGVMAQYACMRELGWLNDDDIRNYFGNGTILKGLSDAHVPGLEVTSGSLGHGLSVGVGMALGAKRKGSGQRCYAIVGDGEMNEGAIWEAILFAAHFKLDNLTLIVDENGFQAMGATYDILNLGNLVEKLTAFGFDSQAVDGHDEVALDEVLSKIKHSSNGKPQAIVAKTVKGKGVSFMENRNSWHYTRLTQASYADALAEINATSAANGDRRR